MGGECNYLLRVAGPDKRLQFVPDAEWKSAFMRSWSEPACESLLDAAEALLLEGAHRLRLPVQVIRKERAVGVVPTAPTIYEVLEELALTVQVRGLGGCRGAAGGLTALLRGCWGADYAAAGRCGPVNGLLAAAAVCPARLAAPQFRSHSPLVCPRAPPPRRTSCRASCRSAPSTAATTCSWTWATRAWGWRR